MDEAPSTPFVMHGAREAMAAGLSHVDEVVLGIEEAVVETPGLAFDLARTLVESTCRAILRERKVAYSEDDDLPKLFKTVSNCLPFLPPKASGEADARESLRRTLGGLSTAIQGVCELRNRCGFASHGTGRPRPTLESVQARLAAGAADTIVGFLHRVHCQDRSVPTPPRALFEANPAYNAFIDGAFGPIRVFDSQFRPSEVLLEMEPESYRIHLTEFESDSRNDEEDRDAGAGGTQ